MPSQEVKAAIWNITVFAVLVLALGAAATTVGLFAHNIALGFCPLFITDILDYDLRSDGNHGACGFSLATAIIAMVCLTIVALIELIQLVMGTTVKVGAVIAEVVLLIVATVLLLITTIVLAAGWGVTCRTFKTDETRFGGVPDCNGDFITLNGKEMTGSPVSAGLGMIFSAAVLGLLLVKKLTKIGIKKDEHSP